MTQTTRTHSRRWGGRIGEDRHTPAVAHYSHLMAQAIAEARSERDWGRH